ncbi:histidine-type phosphatase [Rhizosphaericola mali]|uniref:Multiple inositol polyphosphate phosphatase 1 n=1 Tax=Rhizosphaericola mali TaxID=2545455 RepID=A0A5P2G5Z1_9BACT|nr:histidine-type phosphatase [Rhizosphaericola mali]QES89629.1 histidine phosphatase family protein [Rhizosphaericola mali]
MKLNSFLFVLFFGFGTTLFAQKNQLWFGTKAAYHSDGKYINDIPRGYEPFFINHVGRHGSRYMTKAGADSVLFKIFNLAKLQNGLTNQGKKWQKLNNWLLGQQNGKYAEITALGYEQHHDIAGRMQSHYPNVFSKNGHYDIWITNKLRTKQSANGFVSGLNFKNNLKWNQQPENAETMLRFYDYSPIYDSFVDSSLQKAKEDSVASFVNINEVYNSVAQKIFSAQILKYWKKQGTSIVIKNKLTKITPKLIATSLYEVYGVGLSTSIEFSKSNVWPLNWNSPFSEGELQALGKLDGVEDFMVKGPGMDLNGIQAEIAAPLLVNFINTSDSILSGKKNINGIFRFTHAEAIAPMATLMELSQSNHATTHISEYFDYWQPYTVIPMTANIQWIFVKNKTDNILVKVLLNETPQKLPFKSENGFYYSWSLVRKYYVEKLSKMGAHLDGDMKIFLQNIGK